MAYFIAPDRAFTPCSLETFDRGLRRDAELTSTSARITSLANEKIICHISPAR